MPVFAAHHARYRRSRLFTALAGVIVALLVGTCMNLWKDRAGAVGEVVADDEPAAGSLVFQQLFDTSGPLPAGWTGAGGVVAGGNSGSAGSLLVSDTSTSGYALTRSPLIAVAPERNYDLSVDIRTDGPDTGRDITVYVEQFTTASTHTAPGPRIALRWVDAAHTDAWQRYHLNFTTAGRAASIRLLLYPANRGVQFTGRAWFDTVRLTTAAGAVNPVLDVHNRAVPVSGVQNVTAYEGPAAFWARVAPVAADPAVAARSLWSYPLLRRHFLNVDVGVPGGVRARHDAMPRLARTIGVTAPTKCVADTPPPVAPPPTVVEDPEAEPEPATDPDVAEIVDDDIDPAALTCPSGTHQEVQPVSARQVVALDIEHHPIASAHPYTTGKYSTTYYARRMADHLDDDSAHAGLLNATLLDGDPTIAQRADDLLAFLRTSQYDSAGNNSFAQTYYPAEFVRSPQQVGGWDYVYNWKWRDGYGYTWGLHESDHHVGAHMANTMVKAFQITDTTSYLDSAAAMVYYQVPRYGWHTGIWNGKRYYWSEYNPSGQNATGAQNPHLDATDNVEALLSRAIAMVGYHRNNPRMLEYARGLLWYCIREFTTDGRWYYDGGENPMNQRAAVSHDMATLLPLLETAGYLLKAGVPLDTELATLTRAYEYYQDVIYPTTGRRLGPFERINNGQAAKLAPQWDPATASWQVTSFFTANRTGTALTVKDTLPAFAPALPAPASLPVRISRLVPPSAEDDGWTVDPAADLRVIVTPAGLAAGVPSGFAVRPGDVFRVSYGVPGQVGPAGPGTWTAVNRSSFTFHRDGAARTVPAAVPSAGFPTRVTDATYATFAARLVFPDGAESHALIDPS